jgi:hypothetical protein
METPRSRSAAVGSDYGYFNAEDAEDAEKEETRTEKFKASGNCGGETGSLFQCVVGRQV